MAGYNPQYKDHRLWFGGTQFNDEDWSSTGVGVEVSAIEGWEGGVEFEDNREPRPGADGELVNTGRMRGRELVIAGMVNGSSWEDVQARKRVLAGVFVPSSAEKLLKVPKPDADLAAVYANHVVDVLGAVAHWRLSGSTEAVAGDNHEGTAAYDLAFTGSPTLGVAGGLAATSDTAVEFSGTGQWASVGYAAGLHPAAFTVSMWVRFDAVGSDVNLFHARNGSTNGYAVQLTAGGKVRVAVSNGTQNTLDGLTTLSAGSWYHIVAGNDGTNSFVYVGGVSDVSPAARGYTASSTQDVGVAATAVGANRLDGTLQAVSLFPSALTATQIAELYTLGASGYITSDMVGYERASCRVVEPIRFEDTDGPLRQSFVVALRASDPRIYDDVETSVVDAGTSPSVTTSNAGTVESPATLTINGPINGAWRVTNSADGGVIKTDASYDLANDFPAVLDTGERTFLGGIAYATVMSSLSPDAHWKLDDASGNLTDSSGNSYTLTVGGTLAYSQPSALHEGAGNAIQFSSGDSGTRTVTDVADFVENGNAFTWAYWCKLSAATAGFDIDLYDDSPGGNGGYLLRYSPAAGGFLIYGLLAVDSVYLPVPSTVDTTAWNFVSFVWAGGVATAFINGAVVGSKNVTALGYSDPTATTEQIRVRWAGSSGTADIDELAYWNRSLNQYDIKQMYDQGSAGLGSRYERLDAANTTWPMVQPGSNTFTLASDDPTAGTDSGTSLAVAYRPARI